MRVRHIQQQSRRAQETGVVVHLVPHRDRQREEGARVMVQPDARLAQHAQEGLFGTEFRMVVAADVGHPARRLAQPARLAGSRRGTADRSMPAAPAAGSDRGPVAPPVRARRRAADPAARIASGMRCMNQPSRRPLALNTTRRTPVARSTRRSATAAKGRSSMRRRDKPGSRSSARRPAPAITPVRSRASSRLIV